MISYRLVRSDGTYSPTRSTDEKWATLRRRLAIMTEGRPAPRFAIWQGDTTPPAIERMMPCPSS